MWKIQTLTSLQARQLLNKHEQIYRSGTGIVRYGQHKSKISQYKEYVAAVCYSYQQFKSSSLITQIDQSIFICLRIEHQLLQSLSVFLQFFDKQIEPLLKTSNTVSKRFKSVLIQVPNQCNCQQLFLILRYLQSKLFCIVLQPSIASDNWKNYQQSLCQFSLKFLQRQYLFISAISVILKLPDFVQEDQQNYLKTLLAILKRCLPAGLGAIIIEDWLDSERSLQKPILGLHLIKNVKLCWKLHFITDDQKNCESLACQCLGID